MSAPEVNIPLLRKAVEWAEAEAAKPPGQSQWFQGAYRANPRMLSAELNVPVESCGTAYCIAGWACYSNGEEWLNKHAEASLVGDRNVPSRAQELLGLSMYEAELLFDADNTIADVRRIAEDIAGERL